MSPMNPHPGGVDCRPLPGTRQPGTYPGRNAVAGMGAQAAQTERPTMALADRLGDFTRGTIGCGVCLWIDQLDDADRAAFDEWIANGGNRSQLWRACTSDPDNPLRIQLPTFTKCINSHRGGLRDAS